MKKSRFLLPDGTEKLSNTPRPEGTFLYFTSAGDDIENGVIGKGSHLVIDNTIDSVSERSVEVQFLDDIYLKDGYAFWENATCGDYLDCEVVLPANTPMPIDTKNGNADLVNGRVTYITMSPTPDSTWVGNYMMLPTDYVVNRFVNSFHLLGTNTTGIVLESSDAVLINNFLKIRVTYKNFKNEVNAKLKCVFTIECYRERTV